MDDLNCDPYLKFRRNLMQACEMPFGMKTPLPRLGSYPEPVEPAELSLRDATLSKEPTRDEGLAYDDGVCGESSVNFSIIVVVS